MTLNLLGQDGVKLKTGRRLSAETRVDRQALAVDTRSAARLEHLRPLAQRRRRGREHGDLVGPAIPRRPPGARPGVGRVQRRRPPYRTRVRRLLRRSTWASILETLKRYEVEATFFCPGEAVLANPSLGRRTVRDGHVIGSHGWDHADFSRLSFSSAESRPGPGPRDMVEARRASRRRRTSGRPTAPTTRRPWRPPGGPATPPSSCGTSTRATGRGPARVRSRAGSCRRSGRGASSSMHTLPQTAEQLPSLIRALRARHYIPLTLPELDRIGAPRPAGGRRRTPGSAQGLDVAQVGFAAPAGSCLPGGIT